MNKMQAYEYITSGGDVDLQSIASNFLRGKNAAVRLKNLAALIQAGHTVESVPYTMPEDKICINGLDVKPEDILD